MAIVRAFARPSQVSYRRPDLLCQSSCIYSRQYPNQRQRTRTFVTNPFSGPQTVTASRTFRYPAKVIYEVISDVASYKTFVPFCKASDVTKYSNRAPNGKTYPEEAKLTIGFNDQVSDEFWSRVYCVPNVSVEAVSGETLTSFSDEEIAHHNPRPAPEEDPSRSGKVLSHLATRWTLRPYHFKPPPSDAIHPEHAHKNTTESSDLPSQEKTEVNLHIEYQFANPVYAALSSAATPRLAEKMIEAFEKRAKAIVEGPGNVQ